MFNPRVYVWSQGKKDFGEKALMPLLCFPIQPQIKYTKQAVIVSDSTFAEASFKLGLVVKLREEGISTLLVVAKRGAKAGEIVTIWETFPICDLGLTIYNCNDFMPDYLMTAEIRTDIQKKVAAACNRVSDQKFVVNDGRVLPRIKYSAYPGLVK